MAKRTSQYKPVDTNRDSNSMERSITYFNRNVSNFSESTTKLVKSIDTFTKSVDAFKRTVDDNKKTSEKKTKEDNKNNDKSTPVPSKNQQWAKKTQKGLDKFQKQGAKLGLKSLQNFTNDVFGKKAAQNMTRGMARFTGAIGPKGAGGIGKGAIGRAVGGLGTAAGGLLRVAGPVGAIAGLAKMAFDFWDSGGVAKLKLAGKMLTGSSMTGTQDIASVQKSLEGTEQMRKLNAEYNYKVPMQLRQQAADDMLNYNKGIAQDQLQYDQSLVKDKLDYEIGLRRDILQFQFQQAMETLDAELSKRKDIAASGMKFIKSYSSISERALRAIGSSTKMIVEGISKFQYIFGNSVKSSFKLNENAQGLAYHFGVGADDVMNMTNLFRLMGKTSAEMAQSLIGGITQFSADNLLAPQAIFAQIKDAGEDIYKFSSGTAENFVKQAGLLTKMSMSMSQMMKASDTMVLNYKDSIKAEMSLSAMLGKNVNLSEVRARLMSGDQAGAASALKTALGGMDITQMNAFQKQALQQATGMDLSALMGLQQGTGGNLKGGLTPNERAGAEFAKGALKQDISAAASKLALEQEQRKKLLEFEQKTRMEMLQLEQYQRLAGIALEQKYRVLFAQKSYKDAKESMAVEIIADVASNAAMAASMGKMFKDANLNALSANAMSPELTSMMSKPNGNVNVKPTNSTESIQNERLKNIYKAGNDPSSLKKMGISYGEYLKKYKVTNEEVKAAAKQNKEIVANNKNNELLVQANNKLVEQQTTLIASQTKQLNESEYNTKLNQEIISLLGINAQYLGQISENTIPTDKTVNIDGKVLSKTLLNQARRNYGLAVGRTINP